MNFVKMTRIGACPVGFFGFGSEWLLVQPLYGRHPFRLIFWRLGNMPVLYVVGCLYNRPVPAAVGADSRVALG